MHVMVLTETHEGTEVWECPACGRRLYIEWNPWRKWTDPERPGDETVSHSGGKGGLTMRVDVAPR